MGDICACCALTLGWRSATQLRGTADALYAPLTTFGFQKAKNERMTTNKPERQAAKPETSVLQWLLDSDPSIRWQVMRDLSDKPAEVVAAERLRVASHGWGARLLGQQRPDGNWGDGIATPHWRSNLYTLLLLRDLGLDPMSAQA